MKSGSLKARLSEAANANWRSVAVKAEMLIEAGLDREAAALATMKPAAKP